MIEHDPIIVIRDLLNQQWSPSRTSGIDITPHTGWYDFGSGGPQVTVTNDNSFAIEGGATGQTAGTGDGGVVQVRSGTVLVNAWAGNRDDLRGEAPGGGDLNPKLLAFQMGAEIHRIIQSNASSVDEFISVGADDIRSLVDDDVPETVYRREVTVRYTYHDAAAQTP